jgi:hypothetical protein
MEFTFFWHTFQTRMLHLLLVIFSIRKSSIVLCCKSCVMQTKSFEMFVLANLEGYMMVGNLRNVVYKHN